MHSWVLFLTNDFDNRYKWTYLFLGHVINIIFLVKYLWIFEPDYSYLTRTPGRALTSTATAQSGATDPGNRDQRRILEGYLATIPRRYRSIIVFVSASIEFLLFPIIKSLYHILGYLVFLRAIFGRPEVVGSISVIQFFKILILGASSSDLEFLRGTDILSRYSDTGLVSKYLLECLIYWDFYVYGVFISASFYTAFTDLIVPFISEYYFDPVGEPAAPGLSVEEINKLPIVIFKRPLSRRFLDNFRSVFSPINFAITSWFISNSARRHMLANSYKNFLPNCTICMEDFKHLDVQRVFSCSHQFHQECVDPWLLRCAFCPLCKRIIKP